VLDNIAIIQARMSSSRLPGKVLHQVKGLPLLGYILIRLQRSQEIGEIWVATSTHYSDDPLETYCITNGIACFRGDLENVAHRFTNLLGKRPCSRLVRICGDSPWIDPEIVDEALRLHRRSGIPVVTNVAPRTYPPGISVEVIDSKTFLSCSAKFSKSEQEHITSYFYAHQSPFPVLNFTSDEPRFSAISLAVDTPKDLSDFTSLVSTKPPEWVRCAAWKDIAREYEKLGR
jgi:spore coat polysaccharide biosynthesis protein SpsF